MPKNIENWAKNIKIRTNTYLSENINVHDFKKKICCRGNGWSYNDASIYKNVLIQKKKYLKINTKKQTILCTANLTISDILKNIVHKGFILPVMPGSKYVTIGGAISMDVHGKNHYFRGSFCDHLVSLTILMSNGKIKKVFPNKHKNLFRTICSGLGSVGQILDAEIKIDKIKNSSLIEKKYFFKNIKNGLQMFEKLSKKKLFLSAWVDCNNLNDFSNFGRGIIFTHEFDNNEKEYLNFKFLNFKINVNIFFNLVILFRVYNKLFLFLNYYLSKFKISSKKNIDQCYFQLDKIIDFPIIFGKNGLCQYHLIIPKKNAISVFYQIFVLIKQHKAFCSLGVLKMHKKKNKNYLTFPDEGYSLAMDFKNDLKSEVLFKSIDKVVYKNNGKIYLCKNNVIQKKYIKKFYKNFDIFLRMKKKYDSRNTFNSSLLNRLL